VIIELFSLGVNLQPYNRVTRNEYRLKIGRFVRTQLVWPKFLKQGIVPHQPLTLSEN